MNVRGVGLIGGGQDPMDQVVTLKDPRDAVNPGDRVSVRVLEVNLDKQQIALTMKSQGPVVSAKPAEQRPQRRADPPPPREDRKPKVFNNAFAEQLANWKKS